MTTRNLGTLTVPEALAVRLDAELDRARKVSGTSRSGLIRQLCHEALTARTAQRRATDEAVAAADRAF